MDNGKDKQEEYRCFIATEEFKEVKNDKETETVTYENPRRPIKNKRKKAIYHIDELKNIGLHRKIEEYARDLTRRLAVYAFAVITLVAFTFMLMTMCSVGYEGFINGKSVGVADSKEFLQGIREDVNKEIATLTGGDKTGQIKPLKFRFKIVSENNYTPKEKIRENMATFSSALMKGCSIYVDGKKVVVLKSPREAQEVLMAIKEQYYLKGMECTSEIMNKVELVNEQATYASSSTIEQAVRALNDVKDSSRDYMVKSGDTLWGIARSFNTTVQNLIKLNPNIGEKIKADETIQVPSPKPIVDVKTVILNAVIEESIPNTMIEVQDPSLYVGQSKITDYGSDGWHKITADITKINGEEDVSKRIIKSEKIVAEPVPGHIHIGTTAVPKGIGSGKFSWPLRGPITSKFGPRWGSVHTGVDIAVSAGTGVHASDEGRVIFTGWNSSGYGNLIKVDHCNGYQTYYAHLSKIYVKTGDVVAKGEVIAASGSTGNSTGPHLHFEVRKNGSSQNPLKYLP